MTTKAESKMFQTDMKGLYLFKFSFIVTMNEAKQKKKIMLEY